MGVSRSDVTSSTEMVIGLLIWSYLSVCPSDGGGPSPSISEGHCDVDRGIFPKQSTSLDSGAWRMGMLDFLPLEFCF